MFREELIRSSGEFELKLGIQFMEENFLVQGKNISFYQLINKCPLLTYVSSSSLTGKNTFNSKLTPYLPVQGLGV